MVYINKTPGIKYANNERITLVDGALVIIHANFRLNM
jgi:hypothetical protein